MYYLVQYIHPYHYYLVDSGIHSFHTGTFV